MIELQSNNRGSQNEVILHSYQQFAIIFCSSYGNNSSDDDDDADDDDDDDE